MKIVNCDEAGLAAAAEVLLAGGVAVVKRHSVTAALPFSWSTLWRGRLR